MKFRHCLLLALSVGALQTARADVYVSNLSESYASLGFGGTRQQATTFTTGATGAFDLSRITLQIQIAHPSIQVEIYAYSASGPSTLLGTFNSASITSGRMVDFLSAGGALTLTPNTSYFLVIAAPGASDFGAQTSYASTPNQASPTAGRSVTIAGSRRIRVRPFSTWAQRPSASSWAPRQCRSRRPSPCSDWAQRPQ